ncbi:MAG: hypothetical protein ABI433_12560 [Burkholderiaceae bacterium]
MKTALLTTIVALFAAAALAGAADEPNLLRLSTCQDSWLDWKSDEPRMSRYVAHLQQKFVRSEQDASFAPKTPTTLLGHPLAQVYPQSVGMGVGFSALLNVPFAQARQSFEKQLGRPLTCSSSDGMKACELSLGDKKTAMLMASDNPASKTTLLGCYYYYEK